MRAWGHVREGGKERERDIETKGGREEEREQIKVRREGKRENKGGRE